MIYIYSEMFLNLTLQFRSTVIKLIIFETGGWVCISTVSLAELLGVENLAKSYGVMQIAGSLAYFTTSPYHGTCNFFCHF